MSKSDWAICDGCNEIARTSELYDLYGLQFCRACYEWTLNDCTQCKEAYGDEYCLDCLNGTLIERP